MNEKAENLNRLNSKSECSDFVGGFGIDETKRIVAKIDGFLTDKEGETLYKLAKDCLPNTVIVEIGSWKGKSTIWLSKGSKAGNNLKVFEIGRAHV